MVSRRALWPSIRIVILVVSLLALIQDAACIFDYPPVQESGPEGITCQRLAMTNQTKILCHTRTDLNNLEKIRKKRETKKDGRVCTKIFNLVQR